jgi:hypothetical protein
MSGADVSGFPATERSQVYFPTARIVVVRPPLRWTLLPMCFSRIVFFFPHTQDGCLLHFPVWSSCMSFLAGPRSMGVCITAFSGFPIITT